MVYRLDSIWCHCTEGPVWWSQRFSLVTSLIVYSMSKDVTSGVMECDAGVGCWMRPGGGGGRTRYGGGVLLAWPRSPAGCSVCPVPAADTSSTNHLQHPPANHHHPPSPPQPQWRCRGWRWRLLQALQ